jgi:hypothetical protein
MLDGKLLKFGVQAGRSTTSPKRVRAIRNELWQILIELP